MIQRAGHALGRRGDAGFIQADMIGPAAALGSEFRRDLVPEKIPQAGDEKSAEPGVALLQVAKGILLVDEHEEILRPFLGVG